jgi:hypothetical protein
MAREELESALQTKPQGSAMHSTPALKSSEGMERQPDQAPENLPLVALLQKAILAAMAGMLVATMAYAFFPAAASLVAFASIANAFLLCILAYLLRMRAPLLYFVLGFLPPLGLLAVFAVNARATSVLKKSGLRVGLFGVSLKDVEALETR